MATETGEGIDRRTFVKQAGIAALAAGMDARSYARVLGANDRIRLGQLGCGSRSHGHVHMTQLASKQMPVETVAVCDIWSKARERRAAQVKKAFNLDPQSYKYSEDMLARKDIDGVMIATGDFQHAKLCIEVVQAGKDCYVEKPFANVLSEAIAARNAVKASKQVVQMGSQHRTQPYQLAVRDLIRSGRIGKVVHIEQEWNVNEERWRFVEARHRRYRTRWSRTGTWSGRSGYTVENRSFAKRIPIGIAGCWANRTAPSIPMSIWSFGSIKIIRRAFSISG